MGAHGKKIYIYLVKMPVLMQCCLTMKFAILFIYYFYVFIIITLFITLLLLYSLPVWMIYILLHNYINTGIYARLYWNTAHKLRDSNLKTTCSILTWIKEFHKQHICIFLELYDVCTPPQRHWENNNTTF